MSLEREKRVAVVPRPPPPITPGQPPGCVVRINFTRTTDIIISQYARINLDCVFGTSVPALRHSRPADGRVINVPVRLRRKRARGIDFVRTNVIITYSRRTAVVQTTIGQRFPIKRNDPETAHQIRVTPRPIPYVSNYPFRLSTISVFLLKTK